MSVALWTKLGLLAFLLIWGSLNIPGFWTTPIPVFRREPGDNVLPFGTGFGVSMLVGGLVVGGAIGLRRLIGLNPVDGGAILIALVYIQCAIGRPQWLLAWMRLYPMFTEMDDVPLRITCGGLAVVFLAIALLWHPQLG
jgi:hypothetical protein